MLIMFTNHTFGEAFVECIIRYCLRHKLKVLLVFSIYYGSSQKRLHGQRFIEKLQKNIRSEDIHLLEAEVNSEVFLNILDHWPYSERCGLIAGFNQIFKPPLLSKFQSLVNFHPSLLPYYRGPIPSYWCIKNAEIYSGFTLHEVTEEIDKGRIIYQEVVETDDLDDPSTLDRKIARSALPIMIDYINGLRTGKPMISKSIDAKTYLRVHVDYLSFSEI